MPPLRLLLGGLAIVVLSLVLVSCSDSDDEDGATSSSATSGTPSVSATTDTTTSASTDTTTSPSTDTTTSPSTDTTTSASTDTSATAPGSPAADCVGGWVTPEHGTDLRTAPLDSLRGFYGVTGLFVIDEMRYFEGPQDPNIIAPRFPFIRHWYVKASLQDDPDFRARWLLQAPPEGTPGIVAAAPYGSTGWQPGSWVSFFGESDELFEYPELPGLYFGVPYDSVSGIVFDTGEPEGGPAVVQPENVGCLQGT